MSLESYIFPILLLSVIIKGFLNREYYLHVEFIDKGLPFPMADPFAGLWFFGNLFRVWWKSAGDNQLTEKLRRSANISNLVFISCFVLALLVVVLKLY